MAGTMPGDPRLRASDADRDRTAARLREHHAVGRLTAEEFERLKRRHRKTSLVQFFAESPLVGSGIDLERKPDYGRKIKL